MKQAFLLILFLLSINVQSQKSKLNIQLNGKFVSDSSDSPGLEFSQFLKLADMNLYTKNNVDVLKCHDINLRSVKVEPTGSSSLIFIKSIKIFISTDSKEEVLVSDYEVLGDSTVLNIFMNVVYKGFLDEYIKDSTAKYRIVYYVTKSFKTPRKYDLEFNFRVNSISE